MMKTDLRSMSVDGLWSLREQVAQILLEKISEEKARLDQRLIFLRQTDPARGQARRPYPRVAPKYRNPARPGETWAGRGKPPRWLAAQLKTGKSLDDFKIRQN